MMHAGRWVHASAAVGYRVGSDRAGGQFGTLVNLALTNRESHCARVYGLIESGKDQ